MRRAIIMGGVAAALAAGGVLAADAAGTDGARATEAKRTRRPLTQQERIALHERAMMRRTGGIVRKADSARGAFAVLNAQKRVGADGMAPALDYVSGTLAARAVFVEAEGLTVGNVAAKIAGAGATVGVGVVDDAALPALLVAPEGGWALVNVARLGEGCPGDDVLAARVRKEILRGLAFTTGCAYATLADPLMRDVTKPGDVDALQAEAFGFELINRFMGAAPLYGLKPWYSTTYRRACEEGWAPAPTNDVQRAIWEQTRADKERGPANAIRIPPPSARK